MSGLEVVVMEHLLNKSAEAQMGQDVVDAAIVEERDRMKDADESESRKEEYRWLVNPTKSQARTLDRTYGRDEQLRERVERKVIPENTCNSLMETSCQEKFGAGFTALSYTATRVPASAQSKPQRFYACSRYQCQGHFDQAASP